MEDKTKTVSEFAGKVAELAEQVQNGTLDIKAFTDQVTQSLEMLTPKESSMDELSKSKDMELPEPVEEDE